MTECISKSEQKRRVKQIEAAAAELAVLSDNDLVNFPASDQVRKEIIACRSLKGGARKRQIKYLAKIIREDSVEDMLEFLALQKGSKLKTDQLHHEAERLRDLLVNEVICFQEEAQQKQIVLTMDWPAEQLSAVVADLEINEKEIRTALYQYVRTRARNNYREIFRMIKAALEKKERIASLSQP